MKKVIILNVLGQKVQVKTKRNNDLYYRLWWAAARSE